MSSYVTLRASPTGWLRRVVGGRAAAPAGHTITCADPGGRLRARQDDASMIMRALFTTAWLIADQLGANGLAGCRGGGAPSASSKTALRHRVGNP